MAKRLTPRRQAFVEIFLRSWNATEAARAAGYSERSAHNQGHRLMKNDDIRAVIQERLQELHLSADEVLVRLAQIARGEHGDYIQPDGSVDLERMQADGKLHLIRSVRPTRYGLVVEFNDMLTALVHIGRHLGLFVDRIETSNHVIITAEDVAQADKLLREFREEMAEQEGA